MRIFQQGFVFILLPHMQFDVKTASLLASSHLICISACSLSVCYLDWIGKYLLLSFKHAFIHYFLWGSSLRETALCQIQTTQHCSKCVIFRSRHISACRDKRILQEKEKQAPARPEMNATSICVCFHYPWHRIDIIQTFKDNLEHDIWISCKKRGKQLLLHNVKDCLLQLKMRGLCYLVIPLLKRWEQFRWEAEDLPGLNKRYKHPSKHCLQISQNSFMWFLWWDWSQTFFCFVFSHFFFTFSVMVSGRAPKQNLMQRAG